MVKEISLTQGKVALVDDADYEYLTLFNWQGSEDKNTWYAKRAAKQANGRATTVSMHREILSVARGVYVDHIDGDGLNNQRHNLRQCTAQQNQFNARTRTDNASGYKNVYWHKREGRWCTHITINGKLRHIGSFLTIKEAVNAYNEMASKHYGEFARLTLLEDREDTGYSQLAMLASDDDDAECDSGHCFL